MRHERRVVRCRLTKTRLRPPLTAAQRVRQSRYTRRFRQLLLRVSKLLEAMYEPPAALQVPPGGHQRRRRRGSQQQRHARRQARRRQRANPSLCPACRPIRRTPARSAVRAVSCWAAHCSAAARRSREEAELRVFRSRSSGAAAEEHLLEPAAAPATSPPPAAARLLRKRAIRVAAAGYSLTLHASARKRPTDRVLSLPLPLTPRSQNCWTRRSQR